MRTRRCHWQTWFEVVNFKLSSCRRNFIISRLPAPARFQLLILNFEEDHWKTIIVHRHWPLDQHRTVRLLRHSRTRRRNSLHCFREQTSTHNIILHCSNPHHRNNGVHLSISAVMEKQCDGSTQQETSVCNYALRPTVSAQCTYCTFY